MCMRFWACPSQCQDLMLKEVNKLWESYDPERILTGGPRFLALNEIGLKITQCNIKYCIGWSSHWIIHAKVILANSWYILESHSPLFPLCTIHKLVRVERCVIGFFCYCQSFDGIALIIDCCWFFIDVYLVRNVNFMSIYFKIFFLCFVCPYAYHSAGH